MQTLSQPDCCCWIQAIACQQAVLAGFFENKDADAKARGAPPPKQVQAEDYDEFMASLASDVRDLEAREEAAAEDAAQERAEREGFEQRCGPACAAAASP